MMRNMTHDCVNATIVNGVLAERGLKAETFVLEAVYKKNYAFKSFRQLGEVLKTAEEAFIRFRTDIDQGILRAIQNANILAAFEALATKRFGVCIVLLQEDSKVDHAVMVDAKRCLIGYSEDDCA